VPSAASSGTGLGGAPSPSVPVAPSLAAPVKTQSVYVPYPTVDPELVALKQAMDKLVQTHPGAVGTVEMLRSFAAQIQSGLQQVQ
jgi:hypothetical protein